MLQYHQNCPNKIIIVALCAKDYVVPCTLFGGGGGLHERVRPMSTAFLCVCVKTYPVGRSTKGLAFSSLLQGFNLQSSV